MLVDMRDALHRLEIWFRDCPRAAIALSGGVDSSLVSFLARRFLGPQRARAFIAASPSLKLSDLHEARRFCGTHAIELELLRTQELDDPRYAANPINRCYFCKTTLYDTLAQHLVEDTETWILNGTNKDDASDYRPGIVAATEQRVRSPLAECEIDKRAVRELAARFELACALKPASPCMSSRIPYGQRVTLDKLRQIEAGEAFITRLGFPIVRLRHHGDRAVIEVPTGEVPKLERVLPQIAARMCELGFLETSIDNEGFVSGKLNRGRIIATS